MTSLLPPIGSEVFRRLTSGSLEEMQQHHEAECRHRRGEPITKVLEKDPPEPAPDLEDGKPLPLFLGAPPPELLSVPLEELDPFYQPQKTFIVLSRGNIIHRFNADAACFLLSPISPLRMLAIRIVTHSLFSLFIMMTILINCVFMLASEAAYWSRTAELVFVAIYLFETAIKLLSRGVFVGRFSFIRDPWSWLDLAIIITAFASEVMAPFRVIRVFKLIPNIPGLKTTVWNLVQSGRRLVHVMILMVFILSCVAVVGLQLFMGELTQKCIRNFGTNSSTGCYDDGAEDCLFDYHAYINSPENYYFLPGSKDALLCGNRSDAVGCPEGYICLRAGRNPDHDSTSYDSFGVAFVAAFRLMTRDFWQKLAQQTMQVVGTSVIPFFIIALFFGSFYLLSLTVAVVAMAIVEQNEATVTEAKRREKEFTEIMLVLKNREEEEAASREAPSDNQDSAPQKKSSTVEVESHEQEEGPEGGRRWSHPGRWATVVLRCSCCGCWRQLHAFIQHPVFELGIISCVILNTVFLALDHYPMTPQFEWMLSVSSLVFTGIFAAEMLLKLVAMGPCGYFRVKWNVFDSILVVVSVAELMLADGFLHVLITLRLLRLARWWPTLLMFLRLVATSLGPLRNLSVVLAITIFFFSVVGVQLFGSIYTKCVNHRLLDCRLPRWQMRDYFHAFLVVFRAMCGEWVETMWDCNQPMCAIYVMIALAVGNLVILNLFLALVLSLFPNDLAAPEEETSAQVTITWIRRGLARTKVWIQDLLWMNHNHTAVSDEDDHTTEKVAMNIVSGTVAIAEPKSQVEQQQSQRDQDGNTPEFCCSDRRCYTCCPFLDSKWGPWSKLRRRCFVMVEHKDFELVITFIILLSSALLVFEDVHMEQRQVLKTVLYYADLVFVFIFVMEMVLKWVGVGFKSYFSSSWCWLDFLVVNVSLVSVTACLHGYASLGSLKCVRSLRTLSRFQGVKRVVGVLLRLLPGLVDVLLACLLVWLMFSIIGIVLFAGKFEFCLNQSTGARFLSQDVNNKSDCLSLMMENYTEVRWTSSKIHYNNVAAAYLALLQLATRSSWCNILYSAVDSRQVESQPQYEANLYVSLYFVCFIICSFFTFIFFIRFIINQLMVKFGGKHVFMTEEQKKYWTMKTWVYQNLQNPDARPGNRFQALLYDLVTKPCFDIFMMVMIGLNMVPLMVETVSQSWDIEITLYWLHFIFIIIFFFEAILKIIALRWRYFTNGWNILDLVLIICMITGMFLADLISYYFMPLNLLSMFRLFRILRILPLIPGTKKIQTLLLALRMSLPALLNISLLLFFTTFTFAIIGMLNFGYIKKKDEMHYIFNFETFWSSIISLFVASTSTAWADMLQPFMNSPPDCDPDIQYPGTSVRGDCGSPMVGVVFFTSYISMSFLLLVCMVITVVLETLNMDAEEDEPLCEDVLEMFDSTWKTFDPNASMCIQYSELSILCDTLKNPLRIPKPNTVKLIHMDLPLLPGDKIHYLDVLLALTAQAFGDSRQKDELKARMEEKFTANSSSELSCKPISTTLHRKREEVAASVIQRAFRKRRLASSREMNGDSEGTEKPAGSAPSCYIRT